MIQKRSGAPLLLAGLAALAYFKYQKLTPEEKADLKAKGKDFIDKYVPAPVKDLYGKLTGNTEQTV